MLQQGQPVATFLIVIFRNPVVTSVGRRIIFLHPEHRKGTRHDQQGRPNVEGNDHGLWDDPLLSRVGNPQKRQQEGEDRR